MVKPRRVYQGRRRKRGYSIEIDDLYDFAQPSADPFEVEYDVPYEKAPRRRRENAMPADYSAMSLEERRRYMAKAAGLPEDALPNAPVPSWDADTLIKYHRGRAQTLAKQVKNWKAAVARARAERDEARARLEDLQVEVGRRAEEIARREIARRERTEERSRRLVRGLITELRDLRRERARLRAEPPRPEGSRGSIGPDPRPGGEG